MTGECRGRVLPLLSLFRVRTLFERLLLWAAPDGEGRMRSTDHCSFESLAASKRWDTDCPEPDGAVAECLYVYLYPSTFFQCLPVVRM